MDDRFDSIVTYTISQLKSGVSRDDVIREFHDQGYPQNYIDAVFAKVDPVETSTALPPTTLPKPSIVDFVPSAGFAPGRVGRAGYIRALLSNLAIIYSMSGVFIFVYSVGRGSVGSNVIYVILISIMAILLVPFILFMTWLRLRLSARRLHDIDQNGFWALLDLLGGINILMYIILALLPGNKTDNRYGSPNNDHNPIRVLGLTKQKQ